MTNEIVKNEEKEPIKVNHNDILYRSYERSDSMDNLIAMIQTELSEPYSIFLYRYFLDNFPDLTILAIYKEQIIGVIIGKIEIHGTRQRGYIAMLTVLKEYRRNNIAQELVKILCQRVENQGGDEIVLETECVNIAALKLYESNFFVFLIFLVKTKIYRSWIYERKKINEILSKWK